MTKHNEIRHILAKCEKCKTPEQYSYIHNFIRHSEHLHHIIEDRCDGCQCDDFGMCLNTDDDNFFFMCLPRIVKLLEKELLTSGINSITRKSKDTYASLKNKHFSDVPSIDYTEVPKLGLCTTDLLNIRDKEIQKILECTVQGKCCDDCVENCEAVTSAELLDLIKRLTKANKELSEELEEAKIGVQSFKLKYSSAVVTAKEMQLALTEMAVKLAEFQD